ncbi:MAG: SAM-dependent methyltransferase [Kordia sp.]|nr:MAG: SAM-dependent methyltransferase [Kordia sp.]
MKQLIKSIIPKQVIEKYRSYKQDQNKKRDISLYKGSAVKCPICNSSFKIFGEFGLNKRINAKCHNCSSLERHRLIYLYLSDTINIFDKNIKPIRLLHFAPEKIFYEMLAPNQSISYTPCDLFPELYNYGGKSKIEKVDITNIPFEDQSFDFILCNHVLEHIPDDNLAMSELYRVLSYGGNGIFQVPIDYSRKETYEDWSITSPEEREKAFGQSDHVRWYGQDYKNRLEKVGFTVNEIDVKSKFTSDEIFKFGLMESEKIYHCKK